MKYKMGYTAGVYDMFHIGHLNVIKNAKALCETLIVAVSTDELVQSYKNKTPIISYKERKEIVEAIRYVDKVIPQTNMDKKISAIKNKIDVMFVGDDWKGTEKWNRIEKELSKIGVDVVYLPHTEGISSTILRTIIQR
ncbi:MAG: adenylyltransferase/cytidyltransferase family protein [Mediterraneibacter gnavus]